MELSDRLKSLPPYHFAAYRRKLGELRAAGVDIIDLSMGDPDLPTPPEVVERLRVTAGEAVNQHYPEFGGMPALRTAFAAWFERRFGVALDHERELLPLLGSKEGVAHLPLAVLNPGDVALIPDPYYPAYPTAVALAGGTSRMLPVDAAHGWLPDLGAVPAEALKGARMLWLNYPNNPTGAAASHEFFEEAVRFARAHGLLLVHDMAYAEVTFDGYRPPSILEVDGAREVAIEFHSLSKAYNMAGFRVGMAVGNAGIVEGLARLKSNIDTGIFRPIQYAAITAIGLPESWLDERNAIYQGRRDRVLAACGRLGLAAESPRAGLYIWPRIPAGRTSAEFALELLDRAGLAVTPGTNFGAGGEGYLRISLTVPDARLDEALARLETVVAARA
ncbi:MAG TPA: LL-diaminopimelate aminotransferase [Ktedonobacterales bacterium]